MATAGLAHVLSISGLHLTLVAGGVYAVLRLMLALAGARLSVKKIAAQMDRLLEEIPSLEGSLDAWDASMPKLATFSRDGSMQLNLLVAELDGLKFERSDDLKLKIAGFSNGYQSLPGVGRLVLSSREHAATLRALAKPSESDLASAAGEEVAMTAQLSVFNATLAECKRLRAEVSQLAN